MQMRARLYRLSALAIVAAAAIAASGCPSAPQLVNARPIGNGKNMFIVAGTVTGFSLASTGASNSNADDDVYGLITLPSIDLMYRRGIGNHFDLGVSLTGWGKVGIDGKINFINTPTFAMSIDPGIGGFFIGAGDVGAGYLQFTLPLLFDIVFSPGTRLTLAPMYSGIYAFATESSSSSSASAYSHLIGGNIAFEFAVSRSLRLQPYIGAVWYYNPEIADADVDAAAVWWNAGLALKIVF
jgi:hypothetical protein